jgi:hypothetical protein
MVVPGSLAVDSEPLAVDAGLFAVDAGLSVVVHGSGGDGAANGESDPAILKSGIADPGHGAGSLLAMLASPFCCKSDRNVVSVSRD